MGKSRRKWKCLDCSVDCGKIGEHYMLADDVWFSIAESDRGMLCVGCLEGRLGRRLVSSDFNDSYVNQSNFGVRSARLTERLFASTGGRFFSLAG